MKNNCLPLAFLTLVAFVSCHQNPSVAFDDQVSLAGADTLVFSLDDSTYYNSKAIFQFEDHGKEYLSFQNDREREESPVL